MVVASPAADVYAAHSPFWAVSRRSALRRLGLAWAGSAAGDAIAMVAFALIAYRAGGPVGVAVLVAVQMMPSAIVAPFLAAAAHRMRRERFGVVVDATRVVLVLAAAALAEAGAAQALVLLLAAALTAGHAASNVARRALTPLLIADPTELTATSVVASVIQAGAQAVGPALAAALLATSRTSVVFGAAAIGFACAAAAEASLPSTADVAVRPPRSAHPLRLLSAGIRAVRSDPQLRLATGLFGAKNVGRGAVSVLVVVVPLELLGLARSGVGWLTALVGIGGVVGGLAASRLVARARLVPTMALGLTLFGVPLATFAGRPTVAVAVAAFAVAGIGNTLMDIAGYSLIGRSARDDLLASVYGVHEALRAVGYTLGAVLTAGIVELAGARAALVCVGSFLAFAALLGELGRARERTTEPPRDDVRALRATPLIGWLPPVALTRVAATAEPVQLPAGDVLVREGDPGDRAYVIVDGELAIEVGNHVIAHTDSGVVGEIALLRDTVRTATVRAVTDSRLLAIERDEFLVAVGGNEGAREAADALVELRLGAI